jgi:hypothetical protein
MHRTSCSVVPDTATPLTQPMRYMILDKQGRCIVLPRSTPSEAIDVIARAIAGKHASAEEKMDAWETLRDINGYRVVRTIQHE